MKDAWLVGLQPSSWELLCATITMLAVAASAIMIIAERIRRGRLSSAAAADLARRHAVVRDELDQRLEAQRLLRQSEARLRAIVEGAPIMLFAIDPDGIINFSAGTGPDPLGRKPGEAVGWPAAELFQAHPEVVDAIRGALSGRAGQVELTQEDRSFSLSLAPFREAGKTAGGIAVAVDVSERRRAEAALRRTVDTLEQVDRARRALLSRLVRAQEEERRRIASDIHDDSIQAMFAVGIRLHMLRTALKDERQLQLLDRLDQTVEATTHRLRHLLFELRPAALDEGGLTAALREYLDTMRNESDIDVRFESSLPAAPASSAEVIAYRIAQEALTNVRKHARARHVDCAVSVENGGIRTRIIDDGTGFDARDNTSLPGHLGLVAMRERAEMAGGWLNIKSDTDRGSSVEFWIPELKEDHADAA